MADAAANSPNDSLRKAAVFVRGLPTDAAAALIARLSADEAASLRASIAALGDVESDELAGVAGEVRDAADPPPAPPGDAVELQITPDAAAASAAGPPAEPGADPFDVLRDADAGAIASYLAGEQDHAVALVLSYLPPGTAAAVLAEYPDDRQAGLLARMSRLGDADPDSVKILAGDLAEWVQTQGEERRRRADRIGSVRDVLAASSPELRRRLLQRLAATEPAVVETLGVAVPRQPKPAEPPAEQRTAPAPTEAAPAPRKRPPAIGFEDLERVDASTLVAALTRLDGRRAVLALAEASDALLGRVESALSKRAAVQLRKRMRSLGPTTLAEVEASQRAWAAAVESIAVARRVRRVASMN